MIFIRKKITFFIRVLFIFLFVSNIFARSSHELVLSDSWVYDSLTAISCEVGIAQFTDSTPLTIAEIKSYLYEIDYDSLSNSGKKHYDKILDFFRNSSAFFTSGPLSVSVEPSINPESYYKSNDSIPWVYNTYERNQFLDVPLSFSAGDCASFYMDMYLGKNQCAMNHDDCYTNLPLAPNQIDINFPYVSYGSTGYKFSDTSGVSFQIGMGPSTVGRTQTGSIINSEYLRQSSYGRLSFYSENFKYTMSTTQLNVDKYMYTHRFDVRLFKKLTITGLETTLTNAPMELRYLNPITIYHGATPWRDYGTDDQKNCEFMGISIQYTPVKYVRLYGLFAMNQYQTPYETSKWENDKTPNSLGGQIGIESYIPIKDGYLHLGAEGVYANPFLYIKQSPDWSLCRTYSENIGDGDNIYEWVGSPFGPDTIAGSFTVGYEKTQKWSVDLKYLYLCQGENANTNVFNRISKYWGGNNTVFDLSKTDNWAYPTESNGVNQHSITPTGTPQYTNRLSLLTKFHPTQKLSFTVQPSYVIIFNNNHEKGNTDWGIEGAFAVKYLLTK